MKTERRNEELTPFSQQLRKKMTPEERHLWYDFLKGIGMPVHRQYVIGAYIADFYVASKAVVIELDGGGHFEPEQMEYDEERDAYMQARGITVLRYTNEEVRKNFDGVCEDLLRKLGKMC